jgi:hypothetical protein
MKYIGNEMFPFQVPQASDMKPMDKVACMVWLSTYKTLKELRHRQDIVQQQFAIAIQQNRPEKTLANLEAVRDYTDAAVAHQQFPDSKCWIGFLTWNPIK